MRSLATRRPTLAGCIFVGASATAAAGQYLLNRDWPAAHLAFAVFTLLALVSQPHRWAMVLLLAHVGVFILGGPPSTLAQWATTVGLGTALSGIHQAAAWLPWRHRRLSPSPQVCRVMLAIGLVVVAFTSLAATAAFYLSPPASLGLVPVVLALSVLIAVSGAEASRIKSDENHV